ncbi:helix-turn-helix domain-containing protein [Ammoniphilus sp. YIM 78166]|uniref:helix-turn-helix domain-containing protein n=1 Tax=Ammoniphilus sp. YIM 78166 TaxID=1644106 RepID=UPI00106F3A78|nr:helix-turn-helix domain-containing protein [Ammoniphilus sp. YIM 78166]
MVIHPEKHHCKHRRKMIYTALEDMDFVWDEKDVLMVDDMWNTGIPIHLIAQNFDRDPDELVVLILDRCRKGFIDPRPGGMWGRGSQ